MDELFVEDLGRGGILEHVGAALKQMDANGETVGMHSKGCKTFCPLCKPRQTSKQSLFSTALQHLASSKAESTVRNSSCCDLDTSMHRLRRARGPGCM